MSATSDPDPAAQPLAGFTVGLTAARRREELAALLTRRGARVVGAPAIRIVPVGNDDRTLAATRACLADPPDVVVAMTGIGFRGWIEAADGWGLGEELRNRLAAAEVLARGPKARGAVRAAGLAEAWSPDSEASDEMLGRLLAEGVAGRRMVVQQHGEPVPGFSAALRAAGAQVLEVPVYRWVPAEDLAPLRRLVGQVAAGAVDCLVFTSAPAAAQLLVTAADAGRREALIAALRGPVLVACVGPVTAAPLERAGVPTVQPPRARLGALVRTVVEELPRRQVRTLRAGRHDLELRGTLVLVDGRPVTLPARQAGVLAALVSAGGAVLTRGELLDRVWKDRLPDGSSAPAGSHRSCEAADEHAVEMTVTRLRSALGPAGQVVQTVVKRGYRLAAPEPGGPGDAAATGAGSAVSGAAHAGSAAVRTT